MGIKEINGKYEIEGLEGKFDATEFIQKSEQDLNIVEVIKSCEREGGVLQSLREAVAFRAEADGKYEADLYQITRTLAIYTFKDGQLYVAFDDVPDKKENLLLARAQEGYDACRKEEGESWQTQKFWRLPMTDKHVKECIERAKSTKSSDGQSRFVEVPNRTVWSLDIYAEQPILRAALGDMAKVNAAHLLREGYDRGNIFTPFSCHYSVRDENQADIRVVLLGGVDGDYLNGINAIRRPGHDGTGIGARARGVIGAKEFQW